MASRRTSIFAAVVLTTVAGCGGDDAVLPPAKSPTTTTATDAAAAESAEQQFPDIVAVDAFPSPGSDGWTFVVTVSSPYDSPERYADGWRILGPDGSVYDEHMLGHHHAAEQPFTRTQFDVSIPAGLTEVIVEGRDRENGYGGTTLTVSLDRGDDA